MDQNKIRSYGTIAGLIGMGLTVLAQVVGVDLSALHLPSWFDKVSGILGLGFTLIPHQDAAEVAAAPKAS